MWVFVQDSFGSKWSPVAGSYEHNNYISDSVNIIVLPILNTDSAPWKIFGAEAYINAWGTRRGIVMARKRETFPSTGLAVVYLSVISQPQYNWRFPQSYWQVRINSNPIADQPRVMRGAGGKLWRRERNTQWVYSELHYPLGSTKGDSTINYICNLRYIGTVWPVQVSKDLTCF
jgi:hypothetical protein